MTLIDRVEARLREIQKVEQHLGGALEDAEKLAEEFSHIRPQPYIVPIERFAGLTVCSSEADRKPF